MKREFAVSWGRGVWVSVSDSVRVGLANRISNTDEGTKPAHSVLSPSTGHELVSWGGSGIRVSVSDRRSSTRATHIQNQTSHKGGSCGQLGLRVWVSVSDSVRIGLARLFAGSHTLYRLPVISACWILKWWVSTANRFSFVVLICR